MNDGSSDTQNTMTDEDETTPLPGITQQQYNKLGPSSKYIYDWLSEAKVELKSTAQIAQALGLTNDAAKNALARMHKAGVVLRTRSTYGNLWRRVEIAVTSPVASPVTIHNGQVPSA